MTARRSESPDTPPAQSIPLQNLSRPPDAANQSRIQHTSRFSIGHGRTPSLLARRQYQPVSTDISIDSAGPSHSSSHQDHFDSPQDAAAFSGAAFGLSFDGPTKPLDQRPDNLSSNRRSFAERARDNLTLPSPLGEDDLTPLTHQKSLRSAMRSNSQSNSGQRHDRELKRGSVSFANLSVTGSNTRQSRLGDDLPTLNTGSGLQRKLSSNSGILRFSGEGRRSSDQGRSRSPSPSPSPLARASSVIRGISERVVNISNDSEIVEQKLRRKSTISRSRKSSIIPRSSDDVEPGPDTPGGQPNEEPKRNEKIRVDDFPPTFARPRPARHQNPLKGKSLGIFGPENTLRKWLLELLTHPATEPIILVLIVAQTVLLAVNAAADAQYLEASSRQWGRSVFDYAIFGLFIIYTLEVACRIIVSGFVVNATDYTSLDRSKGVKAGVIAKIGSYFSMYDKPDETKAQRRASIDFQPSIVRAFTGMPDEQGPGHSRQKQRVRLARRAFLRHSFNRLDIIAVISYWISFAMQLGGVDSRTHVYIFNMMSCLRILRLLGLTGGTTIILRSLKKAAPLLVNIAFLIGFFWLIFGIVGVQSFKASLRRTCVWVGDDGSGQNYTLNVAPENIQFCGGYLNSNGDQMPWLRSNGAAGATSAKGYLCPVNSLCVENDLAPYNGTVSFDNIVQSMELVFVIISSNTWSDLMYYLTDTDYLSAAIFFAVGIVILSLWLVNLLIAVITSCFQIIREESKQSAFTTTEKEEHDDVDQLSPGKTNKLKTMFGKTKYFWITIITFDLIVMCLRSSGMSSWRQSFIMNTETVVTLLLLLEIIIRLICDWRYFFRSHQNITDLFLAVATTIIQIPVIRNSGTPYAWLTAFQIARIYRVVLAIPVTRDLILLVFSNSVGLFNLIIFVFLFTFLAAILASQMFRGDIPATDPAGNTIEVQFFDIWNSFIGMYIIFSSENWTTMVYNVTQFNVHWNTAWLGALFFILWFIMANLIVMNMFIAVIQESFDVSEDEKRLQQMRSFLRQKEVSSGTAGGNLALSSMFKMGRDSFRHRDALEHSGATMEQLLKDAVLTEFLDENAETPKPRPPSTHLTNLGLTTKTPGFFAKTWAKISGYNKKDPNPFYSHHLSFRANEEFDPKTVAKQVASTSENRKKAQRQYLARHPKYNVSLFIFKPNNPIRRFCQSIVGPSRGHDRIEGVMPWKPAWYAFSTFTYLSIVAMVVIACVTTPLYQKQTFRDLNMYNNWLVWTDMGFAIIFGVEALIKIIADGFFYTPNAFFRSIWGLIDMIVLISLWISVATTLAAEDSITRGVGALKALRALRLLNISDSARNTFHSVIVVGGYKVLSAMFVSLSLLIPFAILGLNLFNGKFESCNDNNFNGLLTNCVGEYNNSIYNWPVLGPRTVSNPQYSFDDFAASLFILFQIVSQEGWTGVLSSGMSVTGVGQQPQNFAAQGNAVYFIVFNLLGAVFVLTLFISVFMRNYTEQTGVAFLTAEQRSWLELRKILKQIAPTKKSLSTTSGKVQRWCYGVASKKKGKYPRFITTCLLLHLGLLVIEYYPEPQWWDYLRACIFIGFELVFMTNVVIRIVGLTWDRFRRSSWDLFSLPAVFGAFITSIMSIGTIENRIIDQLHKLFLVSIPFLLIPRNNQLDQLFKTAAASLPLITNLLATWFVLFLVFAIALTQAFSLTRFGANENNNVNFRNVPKALILLFRMSIGEGWNTLMEDFAGIQPPFCVIGDTFFDGDCGSAGWARGLFVSWNIISMYIFVSLFVSLIFESFSYVYQRSGGLGIVTREEIRRFKTAWSEFDEKGTGYISKEQFPRLLGELSGVFAMRIYDGDFTVRNLIEDCSVQPGENTTGRRIVAGIDLNMLNSRLNQIPVDEIRIRRRQMDIFYQEMMLSADPERGISFTSCLMILAHYNVITDSKSLRLEEFLRRRARLQRVQETIRRNVVVKFFDTLHWKRKFRKHQSMQRDSKMLTIPSLQIPEIFVDDPDDAEVSNEQLARDFTETAPLSPRRVTPNVPRIDTTISHPSSTWSTRSPLDLSPGSSPTVKSPRHLSSFDTTYAGARDSLRDRSPPLTPTLGGHSRQNSGATGLGVMESFDSSAWGESLRRSFTRSRSGSMGRKSSTGE